MLCFGKERGVEYSAEWRLDDSGQEIKEVEFFREIPISRRKVVEAFSNNEEIEKLKQRETKWQFVFNVAAATGVILLDFILLLPGQVTVHSFTVRIFL